jgi:hypothetical protein
MTGGETMRPLAANRHRGLPVAASTAPVKCGAQRHSSSTGPAG